MLDSVLEPRVHLELLSAVREHISLSGLAGYLGSKPQNIAGWISSKSVPNLRDFRPRLLEAAFFLAHVKGLPLSLGKSAAALVEQARPLLPPWGVGSYPTEPEAPSAPPTAGATLRAAREMHGLSIDDVAQQLKLAPRQVQALEDDEYGKLPGRTFVRGFVRNYARFIGLDADDVVALLPGSDVAPSLERLSSFPFNSNTLYTIKGDYSGAYIQGSIDIDTIIRLLSDLTGPTPGQRHNPTPGQPPVPLPQLPTVPGLPDLRLPGVPRIVPVPPRPRSPRPGLPWSEPPRSRPSPAVPDDQQGLLP